LASFVRFRSFRPISRPGRPHKNRPGAWLSWELPVPRPVRQAIPQRNHKAPLVFRAFADISAVAVLWQFRGSPPPLRLAPPGVLPDHRHRRRPARCRTQLCRRSTESNALLTWSPANAKPPKAAAGRNQEKRICRVGETHRDPGIRRRVAWALPVSRGWVKPTRDHGERRHSPSTPGRAPGPRARRSRSRRRRPSIYNKGASGALFHRHSLI
jgi:hypothetical protein